MFVPLRVHSVFSRGRGAATPVEAAVWAGENNLPAAALSDIGSLHGWAKWKRATEAAGVKPLFGTELPLAGSRVPKDPEASGSVPGRQGRTTENGPEERGANGGGRLLLIVGSRPGYANLVEALNRGRLGSGEGLIVIVIPEPASRGSVPQSVSEAAADRLAELRDLCTGNGLYIGADFSNFETAAETARSAGLPLVWANPLKYVRDPDRLVLLHALEKKIPFPPEKTKLGGRIRLFGPGQETIVVRRFGDAARKALARTVEIAGGCVFAFEDIVPPLPAEAFPAAFREVVMARLRASRGLSWRERQRALGELEAVENSGFGPYFLVVDDIVAFARRRGILHNLRGSGASSFLAFLLGISRVNPLEFDLYFERFLNPGRNDPPDIDIDFDSRRRDEVLAYVLEKYGDGDKTGAAFVCSLKNYGARSALYETARAFGIPPAEARAMAKKVPAFADPAFLLRDRPAPGCLEIWKAAAGLDGVHAEISLHVGGVILTPAPADRHLPLDVSAKGLRMSHFDRDAVEDLRLIKLDLLSVRGLAAVSATAAALKLRSIPPGDSETFRLLREARTIGCFQVESPAMMNLLRRLKPKDVHELTAALALIRPGPTECGMKEALLRSREGRAAARDPFLEKLLPETDGLLIYEEQVMQIAERAAGMPPGEGDLLRRELKKKGRNGQPPTLREAFFRGARARGYAADDVERLWRTMEKFSSYAFNKAHSASYAAMAYRAVYLKAHHPVVYLASVLAAGGGYYGVEEYVAEARRCGIPVLPPDINRSGAGFEVEDGAVRVGLGSIKGLGEKAVSAVLEERRNGEFTSIEDFLVRVKPGKGELLALIKAGVFDGLEPRRTRQVLRYYRGIGEMDGAGDISPGDKARMLVEALGFLPGGDILDLYEGRRPALRVRDLAGQRGRVVELVVRVVDGRAKETSRGGRKYFYLFEDETGLLEGVSESKCLSSGSPPVCCLRGEVFRDGTGAVKLRDCTFLPAF